MNNKNFYFKGNIIQMHSDEMRAENGNWFYGYVEHDIKRHTWFILCYVMETNDFSDCCEEPYDIVSGKGNTLAEAAADLRKHPRYNLYPLLKAFNR